MRALITGASSGIGRSFAYALAKAGYDLLLTARRSDRLEALRSELVEKYNIRVELFTCDLTDRSKCIELHNYAASVFADESVDLLINNAGFGTFGCFSEIPLENELSMIDINISALHILTKLFLNDFIQKNSGYILNVASSAAFLPGPLMATYYSTKAYVLHLSEAINEELCQSGCSEKVKVSVLCPGPVDTEFNTVAKVRFALKGLSPDSVAEYALKKMFSGKCVIIPGLHMRLLHGLLRFAPRKLQLRTAYRIQKKKSDRE